MRKAFVAILTIALVSVMAGAGTFAYLTDVESSTSNSLEAGTFDLIMTDNGLDINAEWELSDMVPGAATAYAPGKLSLYHQGSIPADHVEIEFKSTCYDPGFEDGDNEESDTLDGAEGMAQYIKVWSMTYKDASNNVIPIVWNMQQPYGWDDSYVEDLNSNGFIDLADLEGVVLDDLPAPPAKPYPTGPYDSDAEATDFTMAVGFDESAPNDYQGDSCTLELKFTLNQDASQ